MTNGFLFFGEIYFGIEFFEYLSHVVALCLEVHVKIRFNLMNFDEHYQKF